MATTEPNYSDTVITLSACAILVFMTMVFTAGAGGTTAIGLAAGDGDFTADLVLGQPNFASRTANSGIESAYTLQVPRGVAVDSMGRILVADYYNHRVLLFNNLTDTSADMVLGQPTFASNTANSGGLSEYSLNFPNGVAVDSAGKVYVTDYDNHRVLVYNNLLDTAADVVLGQPFFWTRTDNNGGVSSRSINFPNGVAVDSMGKIYVADYGNHRVLVYFNLADTAADFMLGQPNYSSNTPNNGGISANSMNYPRGIAVDSAGRIFVSDYGNNRVLIFNNLADTTADIVLGQPTFTSSTVNNGGVSANSLYVPAGITFDSIGRIFIADLGNNRVLVFNNLSDTRADLAFGQTNLTDNNSGTSASSLWSPVGVAVDSVGRVIVSEENNHRVVAYFSPPDTMPTTTTTTSSSGTSSSSGGGACVITKLGLPGCVMAGLRALRDGVMNCQAGRVLARCYYATSETALGRW